MVVWTDPGLVERRPVWSIPDDGGGGAGVVQTGGRTRWRTFRQTFEQDWMLLVPPIMMMMTCYHWRKFQAQNRRRKRTILDIRTWRTRSWQRRAGRERRKRWLGLSTVVATHCNKVNLFNLVNPICFSTVPQGTCSPSVSGAYSGSLKYVEFTTNSELHSQATQL